MDEPSKKKVTRLDILEKQDSVNYKIIEIDDITYAINYNTQKVDYIFISQNFQVFTLVCIIIILIVFLSLIFLD